MDKIRCDWVKTDLEKNYHDYEWGEVTHDERTLFEFLILETMQAGLSWSTILNKRKAFQSAFDNFDYFKIVNYDAQKINALLNNPAIIRNKLKIKAAISNASCFINIQKEFGSFDRYIWNFTNNQQIINSWTKISEIPAQTELSTLIAQDLRKRGFKFIGSTTIYAFLQAIGMVDDHLAHCFKRKSAN